MMGLLWFDDDTNRDLRQKVGNAARRYTEKFGRPPTVCYVHPSALNVSSDNGASAISLDIGGFSLRVIPRRSVLKDHFLIGVEDEGGPSGHGVPGAASDEGGNVLDKSASGQEWVQRGLPVLEDVP